MRPTVVVVRHGSTALNGGRERVRGWKDVPLDDQGEVEAQKAAEDVAKEGPQPDVESSDLSRAHDTAKVIARRLGGHAAPHRGLRPWHVGELAGKPVSDVVDRMKHHILHPDVPVPGGESYSAFQKRSLRAFKHLTNRAMAAAGRPVVAVTHTRNVRLLHGWVKAGAGDRVDNGPMLAKHDPVPPGGHTVIEHDGLGWRVRRG